MDIIPSFINLKVYSLIVVNVSPKITLVILWLHYLSKTTHSHIFKIVSYITFKNKHFNLRKCINNLGADHLIPGGGLWFFVKKKDCLANF